MKLMITRGPSIIDFELNPAAAASSKTVGNFSLAFDELGQLVRVIVADPTWKELPKVEFEGFSFKTVSFQMKVT